MLGAPVHCREAVVEIQKQPSAAVSLTLRLALDVPCSDLVSKLGSLPLVSVLTLFSNKIISRMVAIRQPTTEFIGSAIV